MQFKNRNNRRRILCAALAGLPFAGWAGAATDTWTTGTGTANWSNAGNWDTPPLTMDDLIFGATTGPTTLNDDLTNATFVVNSITFTSTAPAYTITGNTFSLGTSTGGTVLTNSTTATLETINDAIILGNAAQTITSSGGGVTLSGTISGAGASSSITKTGTGALTLSGSNTFAGGINLSGGNIVLNNASGLGTGTLTIGTGASTTTSSNPAIDASGLAVGAETVANNIVLPNDTSSTNRAIWFRGGAGNILNLSGTISGGGSGTILYLFDNVAADSSGIIRLSNTNIFTGTVAINRGSLQIDSDAALGASTNMLDLSSNTGAQLIFTNPFTYTHNTVLGSAQTLNDPSNVTVSGVISGAFGLTKVGSGTLTLIRVNTYGTATAGTTINAGTLVEDFTQFGSSSTNTPANYLPAADPLTLGGGAFDILGRANGAATAGGAWTGSASSPVLTFSTLPAGLVVGQAVSGSGIQASSYIVSIDAATNTLTLNQNAADTSGSDFSTSATTVTTSQTIASVSAAAGNGSIIITPASTAVGNVTTLTVTSSTGTFTSALNVNTAAGGANADTPALGNAIMSWAAGTAGSIINSNFTVTDAGGTGFATRDVSNNIIRLVPGGGLFPASGAASGSDYSINNNNGGTAAAGSSSLTVSSSQSANSLTVNTTAASGTLTLGANILTSNNWVFGATSGSNTYAINASAGGGLKAAASGGTITFNNYNAGLVTIGAVILANGTSNVVFNGPGTTVLTAINTYTGTTTLNGGIVSITGTGTLGTGAGGLIFNGGAIQLPGGNSYLNPITVNAGGGTISSVGGQVTLGSLTGSGPLTLNSSGTNGLVFKTAGTTYTGTLTIAAGRADFGGVDPAKSTAPIIVNAGGQLYLANGSFTFTNNVSIAGNGQDGNGALRMDDSSGTAGGAVTLTGNASVSSNSATTGGISGTVQGNFQLEIVGDSAAGYTTLSGTNTYSGGTLVDKGTGSNIGALRLGSAGAFPANTALTVGGGGIVDLNGRSITVSSLSTNSGNGTIGNSSTTAASTLTFAGTGAPSSFAGVIQNVLANNGTNGTKTVALIKAGTATLTLSGTNTYTGATTVNAGTLVVNGSLSAGSSVTVADGAILAGNGDGLTTGLIQGPVTLKSGTSAPTPGGTITAGSGPTNTDKVGMLTLANGTNTFGDINTPGTQVTYDWKLGDAAGTAGGGFDTLMVTGLLIGTTVDIVPVALSSGVQNFNAGQAYTWDALGGTANDGSAVGNVASAFHLDPTGVSAFAGALGVSTSSLSIINDTGTGDVAIQYSPAPEPTGMMLLGLGVGGLAIRRRRKPR